MKSKNEYIEDLSTQLREWSAQIDQLTAETEKAAALAKLNYGEDLSALRAKKQLANQKLQELEATSSEGWESLKDTADNVWDDLRIGLADAVAKFK
ncbi:coiled coil domain-containing protein [Methylomonas sp. 2BW1-5-20]|uniref:coiled coil domain-containing protein n=1 Tax=Methylomonas sp. 2BW1-5-20 TaxID=3376686 RepID=UPI00405341E8